MAPVAAQAQNQDHPPRRQTVKFDRISAELPMGQVFARGKLGLLCVQHEAWTWNGASQWINRVRTPAIKGAIHRTVAPD
jgi:hypothetical protein